MNHVERVLVTGGAGFIGSHTVDLLLQHGKEVMVLDNLSSGNQAYLNLKHPKLAFTEGDILELPLLEELMENCDAVLHLAAIASVPFSIEAPIYSMQVNTQGCVHVLQAANKMVQPIRIVFASSAAVYGDMGHEVCNDEEELKNPVLSPYALQKINAEKYAALYLQLYQIPSLALRYFNVYGPRQANSPYAGVISHFITKYQQDKTLAIYGDGTQSRDFISVYDVARANMLALESDVTGVVNIGTGRAKNLLQLLDYIKMAGGKSIVKQHESCRVGDIKVSYGSVTKAEKALNFKSEVELQEGIAQLLAC